jgi:hypothetical protein
MPTSFGLPFSVQAQALREIRENLVSDAELFRREFQGSFNVPRETLGHSADATHYGNISPRTAGFVSSALLAQAERSLRFHRFGEERDMPVLINNYLGICCSYECIRRKIRFIKARHPEAVVDVVRDTVTIGSDRFIFIVNPENDHQRLMGLELTAYKVCSHYELSAELRDRLATRIRQPNTMRFQRYPSLTPLHNIVP